MRDSLAESGTWRCFPRAERDFKLACITLLPQPRSTAEIVRAVPHHLKRGVDTSPAPRYRPAPTRRHATSRDATRAQMAELVDAPASGAGARKGVEVRVLFWAPFSCISTSPLGSTKR